MKRTSAPLKPPMLSGIDQKTGQVVLLISNLFMLGVTLDEINAVLKPLAVAALKKKGISK